MANFMKLWLSKKEKNTTNTRVETNVLERSAECHETVAAVDEGSGGHDANSNSGENANVALLVPKEVKASTPIKGKY